MLQRTPFSIPIPAEILSIKEKLDNFKHKIESERAALLKAIKLPVSDFYTPKTLKKRINKKKTEEFPKNVRALVKKTLESELNHTLEELSKSSDKIMEVTCHNLTLPELEFSLNSQIYKELADSQSEIKKALVHSIQSMAQQYYKFLVESFLWNDLKRLEFLNKFGSIIKITFESIQDGDCAFKTVLTTREGYGYHLGHTEETFKRATRLLDQEWLSSLTLQNLIALIHAVLDETNHYYYYRKANFVSRSISYAISFVSMDEDWYLYGIIQNELLELSKKYPKYFNFQTLQLEEKAKKEEEVVLVAKEALDASAKPRTNSLELEIQKIFAETEQRVNAQLERAKIISEKIQTKIKKVADKLEKEARIALNEIDILYSNLEQQAEGAKQAYQKLQKNCTFLEECNICAISCIDTLDFHTLSELQKGVEEAQRIMGLASIELNTKINQFNTLQSLVAEKSLDFTTHFGGVCLEKINEKRIKIVAQMDEISLMSKAISEEAAAKIKCDDLHLPQIEKYLKLEKILLHYTNTLSSIHYNYKIISSSCNRIAIAYDQVKDFSSLGDEKQTLFFKELSERQSQLISKKKLNIKNLEPDLAMCAEEFSKEIESIQPFFSGKLYNKLKEEFDFCQNHLVLIKEIEVQSKAKYKEAIYNNAQIELEYSRALSTKKKQHDFLLASVDCLRWALLHHGNKEAWRAEVDYPNLGGGRQSIGSPDGFAPNGIIAMREFIRKVPELPSDDEILRQVLNSLKKIALARTSSSDKNKFFSKKTTTLTQYFYNLIILLDEKKPINIRQLLTTWGLHVDAPKESFSLSF